jgi:hypothetical protein
MSTRAVAVLEHGGALRSERIHHLDWLRVLALLGVFLYHGVHPFDTMDWHVKNAEQLEALTIALFFLYPWGMGLFFLLAGSGAFFSLRSRSAGAYAAERGGRLLVPLLAVWLVLGPVQGFIEGRHTGRWTGSFPAFVPRFFDLAADGWRSWPARPRPLFLGWDYHLWFLEMLLWFAFLGLPVFLALRSPRGRRLTTRLAERTDRRGAVLWFAPIVGGVYVALLATFPAPTTGASSRCSRRSSWGGTCWPRTAGSWLQCDATWCPR